MCNQISAASVTSDRFRFTGNQSRPANHKAEIDEVIDLANRSRRKPQELGEFSIATLGRDVVRDGYIQIRAAPVSSRDGLEFRFLLQAAGDITILTRECAKHLVNASQQFDRMVGLASAMGIHAAVDAAVELAARSQPNLRITAIGITPDSEAERYNITVHLETLGNDLNPVLERVIGWDLAEVEVELGNIVALHLRRDELRTQALASRALGWIDGAALRILDASGLSQEKAIDRLLSEQPLEFCFTHTGDREFSASLCWVDGVVRANLEPIDQEWSFNSDCLSIANPGVPATVTTAWKGRRIGDIIEQEFIPPQRRRIWFPGSLGRLAVHRPLDLGHADLCESWPAATAIRVAKDVKASTDSIGSRCR